MCGELISTRQTTTWRVCIDCRKLNFITKKYLFFLSFIDQILEKLTGQNSYYYMDILLTAKYLSILRTKEKRPLQAYQVH